MAEVEAEAAVAQRDVLSIFERLGSLEQIAGGRTTLPPLPPLADVSEDVLREWASLKPSRPLSSPRRYSSPPGRLPRSPSLYSPSPPAPVYEPPGIYAASATASTTRFGPGLSDAFSGERQGLLSPQSGGKRRRSPVRSMMAGEDSCGGSLARSADEDQDLVRRYLQNWLRLYRQRQWVVPPERRTYSSAALGSPAPVERDEQIDESIERIRALQQDLVISASSSAALLNELERLEPQNLAISALHQQQERLQQRASSVRRILSGLEPFHDPFKSRLPLAMPEDEEAGRRPEPLLLPTAVGSTSSGSYVPSFLQQQKQVSPERGAAAADMTLPVSCVRPDALMAPVRHAGGGPARGLPCGMAGAGPVEGVDGTALARARPAHGEPPPHSCTPCLHTHSSSIVRV